MMGVEAPETCWATHERKVKNLWNCCIWLVNLFELYDDVRTCQRQTDTGRLTAGRKTCSSTHFFREIQVDWPEEEEEEGGHSGEYLHWPSEEKGEFSNFACPATFIYSFVIKTESDLCAVPKCILPIIPSFMQRMLRQKRRLRKPLN